MRIVFSYLQIDAMLKQLYINRVSECICLQLCNYLNLHYQSTSSILLRDLMKLLLGGGALEAPIVGHSLECEIRFRKSYKES